MKYLSTLILFASFFFISLQSNGQLVQIYKGSGSVTGVTFSPDGKHALSGEYDGKMKLWEVATGRKIRSFSDEGVFSIDISQDGKYALSGSVNTIKLWDINTGRKLRTLRGHNNVVDNVIFSPDGQYVLSSSTNKIAKLWKTSTGQEVHTFNNYSVRSVAFSPNGRYALLGTDENKMKLWDMTSEREVRTFKSHSVKSVTFSPDGKYVLSGSWDTTIKLWEVDTGREMRTLKGHMGVVNSVAFSPDGKYALSGGYDGEVKFWEVETGRELRSFQAYKRNVISVAFSPDGKYALSGGRFNMKMWALTTETIITEKIKTRIKNWQKKGKYETSTAYQQRVTDSTRNKLIQEYTTQLIDSLGNAKFQIKIAQTDYDADNQTFELTFENESSIYVVVPVSEARIFDAYRHQLKFSDMDFALTEDGIIVRKANIYNPGNDKTYRYDSGREIAFNTTELAANFDPIDISVETDESSHQNIQKGTRKLSAGKADVDVNVPQTSMVNPNAIAVVIGNRYYQGDTPNVDYAVNDAKIMRKYLVKTLGFKPGNILYKENASRNEMVVLLGNDREQGKLGNYLKPNGTSDIFVFYSGHGAPDPNTETGYLMPVDADPTALSLTGYSLDVLYNNLGELNAKSINVVIDACFSGATGQGGMLVQNASPIGIEVRNPAAKLNNGFVVTASSGSQVASWYPEKGHGLLTYFWLKGLQGSADLNSDNNITSAELKSYLSDQSDGVPYYARRLHNREQMPQVFGDESTVIVSHK